jgi:hypothetical protein
VGDSLARSVSFTIHMQNTKSKIRLNLDLSPEVKAQLETVQSRTGATSLTEVIRRALATYDFLTERTNKGWQIVLRHEKKGGTTRVGKLSCGTRRKSAEESIVLV